MRADQQPRRFDTRTETRTRSSRPLPERGIPGAPASGSPGIGIPAAAVIGSLSSQQPVLRATPGLHQEICDYFVSRASLPWPPSPCRRLSRPLTTMGPPTLAYFTDGLLISICEPPTFTVMYSTDARRHGLMIDPSRSSRNPDRSVGRTG